MPGCRVDTVAVRQERNRIAFRIVSGVALFAAAAGVEGGLSAVTAAPSNKTTASATRPAPSGPLVAVVSLRNQRITVYDKFGRVTGSTVSTGTSDHPTPAGIFTVIGKEKEHFSNLYNDAPMPYMQRITWSGVALHAGYVTGSPESHGCIRLPYGFAQSLFGITKMNTRVIVARNDATPFEIQHANLFSPRPFSEPVTGASDAVSGAFVPVPQPVLTPVSTEVPANTPMMLGGDKSVIAGAQAQPTPPGQPTSDVFKALDQIRTAAKGKTPAEFKIQTAAAAQAATKVADAARKDMLLKTGLAQKAVRALRTAETARALLDSRIAAATKVIEAARSPEPGTRAPLPQSVLRAEEAKALAEAKLPEATRVETEARAYYGPIAAEAAQAIAASKQADADKTEATRMARLAVVRAEPVSVFVSKKTNKLYVRQGFEPIFEVPVVFANEQEPVGTHVFTALETTNSGKAMRWNAVTVVGEAEEVVAKSPKKPKDGQRVFANRALTAAAALDRLAIPKEAVERISELMAPGSSLVISDNGVSNETGKGTDFVILTR